MMVSNSGDVRRRRLFFGFMRKGFLSLGKDVAAVTAAHVQIDIGVVLIKTLALKMGPI